MEPFKLSAARLRKSPEKIFGCTAHCTAYYLSSPIGSMVLLYMVTFTIHMPQMLAYNSIYTSTMDPMVLWVMLLHQVFSQAKTEISGVQKFGLLLRTPWSFSAQFTNITRCWQIELCWKIYKPETYGNISKHWYNWNIMIHYDHTYIKHLKTFKNKNPNTGLFLLALSLRKHPWPSARILGSNSGTAMSLGQPWDIMSFVSTWTKWQCVKTNSTPVVHIKIAGKWMWITH